MFGIEFGYSRSGTYDGRNTTADGLHHVETEGFVAHRTDQEIRRGVYVCNVIGESDHAYSV
jgi:hypothetical protein